jgi:hypothetical protein
MIRDVYPGCGFFPIPDSKKHWIPDQDPQHWYLYRRIFPVGVCGWSRSAGPGLQVKHAGLGVLQGKPLTVVRLLEVSNPVRITQIDLHQFHEVLRDKG